MRGIKEIKDMVVRLEDTMEAASAKKDLHMTMAYFMANAWKECLEWVLEGQEVPTPPGEASVFVQSKKRRVK